MRPAGPLHGGVSEPSGMTRPGLECPQGRPRMFSGAGGAQGQGWRLREVVWGGGSALWVRMGGVGGGFALSSAQSDLVFHSLPCGKSIIIMT